MSGLCLFCAIRYTTDEQPNGPHMDDQRSNQWSGDLRANVWLNGVVILALVLATFNHFVHAWDGGSRIAAGLAILDVVCIYLLSLNIARWWRKE
jgi:hypothetical protein